MAQEVEHRLIGRLVGNGWEATLTTAGWECDDAQILILLRAFHPRFRRAYNLDEERHLPWGVEALQAAGKALKARIFVARYLVEHDPEDR